MGLFKKKEDPKQLVVRINPEALRHLSWGKDVTGFYVTCSTCKRFFRPDPGEAWLLHLFLSTLFQEHTHETKAEKPQ